VGNTSAGLDGVMHNKPVREQARALPGGAARECPMDAARI